MTIDFNNLKQEEKFKHLREVYFIMKQYNRSEGWIRWNGERLWLFDGEVEDSYKVELNDLETTYRLLRVHFE